MFEYAKIMVHMGNKSKLFERHISFFHQQCNNREEALKIVADALVEKNIVKPEFLEKLLEREERYPTGLMQPSINMGFALAHADGEYVVENQIGFISLAKPVEFRRMDNGEAIEVGLVFVLALKDGETHMEVLEKLMTSLSRDECFEELLDVRNMLDYQVWLESVELL